MKLYHYSKTPLEVLKSKAAQGHELIEDEFDYRNHISFFFEPIPPNLPSILRHRHSFWERGVKLTEHIIDVNQLPKDVPYMIAETPRMDAFYDQFDWSIPDKREEYLAKGNLEMIRVGLKGHGVNNLILNARPYLTGIANAYHKHYHEWAQEHKSPELRKTKMRQYAAGVWHVLLYVGSTEIEVTETRPVVLR